MQVVKPGDASGNVITDLTGDVLLFFRLLFRSRTALSAEVLFLRKQLAFYEERQVQPRRLNDSARFSLILWSRLCNWKEARLGTAREGEPGACGARIYKGPAESLSELCRSIVTMVQPSESLM